MASVGTNLLPGTTGNLPPAGLTDPRQWKFLRGLMTARQPAEAWLQLKSFYVAPFFQYTFIIFTLLTVTNSYSIMQRIIGGARRAELSIYPIFALLAAFLILPFTKERARGVYFKSAWFYWIIYTAFGFIGMTEAAMKLFNVKFLAEDLFKPWFTIILFPWLAFRTISPEKIPLYNKILVTAIGCGAIVAIVQLLSPGIMYYISYLDHRSAGLWENANVGGFILYLGFYLSFIPTWNRAWFVWTLRVLLFIGIVFSMSRSVLLSFIFSGFIYCLFVGKIKQFALFGVLLVLCLGGFYLFANLAANDTIDIDDTMKARVVSILDLFHGNLDNKELKGSRFHLWEAAIEQIQLDGNLITGTGHGGVKRIRSTGLSPHNDYLHQYGSAGIFGLLAYLSFYGMLIYQALTSRNKQIRAVVLAITFGYMIFAVMAGAVFGFHSMGPSFAVIALWLYYGRNYPDDDYAARAKNAARNQLAMTALPTR